MRLSLLCALLLASALPVHAADQGHPVPAAASQSAPLTDGVIKKIDKAAGEVVIQHGPVDSLGMPPMTMAFGVSDKTWLDKLKAGDRIRFAAVMKQGNPVVSRYEMGK